MNAEQLLQQLLRLQQQGVDLSNLDVAVTYREYDPNVPYDVGVEREAYPDGVVVTSNYLYLRS